ncbi:hypothetical protein ACFFJQ_02695 [Bacillus capparidis]|uniref:Uncharacterized protein n=1 Tax=Bacillus capparidis TaxID=1840411 RepID=A0ABS4CXB6_9BACI|nr:hypothetical protein [Bacillus capparidis]MBP1081745.1 hypothetical protein [Bacillus capparidis]MED1096397.1 hypothetical protein [Bacillus capparidis]
MDPENRRSAEHALDSGDDVRDSADDQAACADWRQGIDRVLALLLSRVDSRLRIEGADGLFCGNCTGNNDNCTIDPGNCTDNSNICTVDLGNCTGYRDICTVVPGIAPITAIIAPLTLGIAPVTTIFAPLPLGIAPVTRIIAPLDQELHR